MKKSTKKHSCTGSGYKTLLQIARASNHPKVLEEYKNRSTEEETLCSEEAEVISTITRFAPSRHQPLEMWIQQSCLADSFSIIFRSYYIFLEYTKSSNLSPQKRGFLFLLYKNPDCIK